MLPMMKMDTAPSSRGRKILPSLIRSDAYQPVTCLAYQFRRGEPNHSAFRPAPSITPSISPLPPFFFFVPPSPTQSLPKFHTMSVARAVRPFASRLLAQPRTPLCRAAPAFRFPRGSTRSFSQSPLGEYMPSQAEPCSRMDKPKLQLQRRMHCGRHGDQLSR